MLLVIAMVKEAEHLIAVSTLEEGAALNCHRLLYLSTVVASICLLAKDGIGSKSEGHLLES